VLSLTDFRPSQEKDSADFKLPPSTIPTIRKSPAFIVSNFDRPIALTTGHSNGSILEATIYYYMPDDKLLACQSYGKCAVNYGMKYSYY